MASLKSALAREALVRSSRGPASNRDASARKERPSVGTINTPPPHAQSSSARFNGLSAPTLVISARSNGTSGITSGRVAKLFSGSDRAVDRLTRETTWSVRQDQASVDADADVSVKSASGVRRAASSSPKRSLRAACNCGVEGAISRSFSARFAASLRESGSSTAATHNSRHKDDSQFGRRVDSPASRVRSTSSNIASHSDQYFVKSQSQSPARQQLRQTPSPRRKPRAGSAAGSSRASSPYLESGRELDPGISGGMPVALSSGSSSTGLACRIALSAGSATSSQSWSGGQPKARLRLGQRSSGAVSHQLQRSPWRAGGVSGRDFGFPAVIQPDVAKLQSRMRSLQRNLEEKSTQPLENEINLVEQDYLAHGSVEANGQEIEDLIAIASADVWADCSSTEGSSTSRSPRLVCDFGCGPAALSAGHRSREADPRAALAAAIAEIESQGTEDVGPLLVEDILASEQLLEETRRRFHARHPSRRAAGAANLCSNAGVRSAAPRSSPGSATRVGSREADRFGVQTISSTGRLSQAQIEELQETQRSLNEENMHLRRDSAALRARLLSWRRLQRRFENYHPESTSPLASRLLSPSASTPQVRARSSASSGSPSSPSLRAGGVRNAATPPARQLSSSASSPACGVGGSCVSPARQATLTPTAEDAEPSDAMEPEVRNVQSMPEPALDVWSCFGRNKAVLEAQGEFKIEVKDDAASSSAPPATVAACHRESATANFVNPVAGESVDLGTVDDQLISIQASLPSDACQ